MSLHLITGHAGTSHVTANNMRHMYAQIFGSDAMVFNCGEKFGYSWVDSKFRLASGEGCIEGAYFEEPVGSYDDLTIESGAAGYNRNDLVCARYQMADDGTESFSAVVIKGTPTTGKASDPSYNTGSILSGATIRDFPLYRVALSGINISSVDQLFDIHDDIETQTAENKSALANKVNKSSLGDQVTFSLSGTTLTITTK